MAPGKDPRWGKVPVKRWSVLHLAVADGSLTQEAIEDPTLIGLVDLAIRSGAREPVTVLGTGPLAGGADAGAGWLVAVGGSPVWGGLVPDFLGRAGPAWDALGIDALVLHGQAAEECALALVAAHGRVELRRLPVSEEVWRDPRRTGPGLGGDAVGLEALRLHLLSAGWSGLPARAQVLLTGPAARRSSMGSLRLRPLLQPPLPESEQTVSCLVSRGGLGSRLAQQHRVVALAFAGGGAGGGGEEPDPPAGPPDGEPDRLPFSMLVPLRDWLLSFNNRSIFFARTAREELYEFLVARNLLSQLESRGQPMLPQADCGRACPKSCLEPHEYCRADEPVLAFGPQIGVFDLDAVQALTRFADALGVDLLEGAALTAWLMECLESGWLEPAQLGVPGLPRWDPEDFDPAEDSWHNAATAGGILETLLLGTRSLERLPADLRGAALRIGGQAGQAAVYLAAGPLGWMSPSPVWGPDFLCPLALPVRLMLRDRYEYVPPTELGLRAARWLTVELALANLGICPERRSWALAGGLEQAFLERGGGRGGWEEHHRGLARKLEQRIEHVPLPSRRGEETLMRSLLLAQLQILPDPDLDRWVARMRRDTSGACRAYLAQVSRGVDEYLKAAPG